MMGPVVAVVLVIQMVIPGTFAQDLADQFTLELRSLMTFSRTVLTRTLIFLACLSIPGSLHSEESATGVQQLKPLNSLIGTWRGTGQLKRGSARGAWSEKMECEWSFADGPCIKLTTTNGREFSSFRISWDDKASRMVAHQQSGTNTRTYTGRLPQKWPGKIELMSEPNPEGVSYRCTLHQLNEIRATLLFERRSTPTGSFRRVCGIGYTRSGETLAKGGASGKVCVVTGGRGTIPIEHKGKTYYVCCQGCVQAFNAAPDEVIADYLKSLKDIQK